MRRELVTTLALLAVMVMAVPAQAGNGASQLRGLGTFDGAGVCNDPAGAGSDLALVLEGDLVGCLYQYWGPGEFRPSNTYYETGTELFVGCLADGLTCGTFETTYVFTAKYGDTDFSDQKFGRCQHPIVAGTGTGDFAEATGRLDFKDDIEAGNFPMHGHIRLP